MKRPVEGLLQYLFPTGRSVRGHWNLWPRALAAALLIIAPNWTQPKCTSTEGLINKSWGHCTQLRSSAFPLLSRTPQCKFSCVVCLQSWLLYSNEKHPATHSYMENISRHYDEPEKPNFTEHTEQILFIWSSRTGKSRFLVPGQDGVNALVPPPSAKSS